MSTISQWLKTASLQLTSAGLTSARLDSQLLIEHVLKMDRATQLANLDKQITPSQLAKLNILLKRRAKHEPIAYLCNKVDFYVRIFYIDSSVLVPRPESETMITQLKHIFIQNNTHFKNQFNPKISTPDVLIADLGCGSGALGITAALELPKTHVDLIDISTEALKTAKTNVDIFTIDVNLIKSDLLTDCPKDYNIVLANLPYVPDDMKINKAAKYEPGLALYGGQDGLDLYRRLSQQLQSKSIRPLYLLIEAFPFQHQELTKIFAKSDYRLTTAVDFIQVFTQKT